MKRTTAENITNPDRVVRIVVGLGLVYSVTLSSGPIGVAAILPLVAIYPLMTGFLGWDPVVSLRTTCKQRSNHTHKGTLATQG